MKSKYFLSAFGVAVGFGFTLSTPVSAQAPSHGHGGGGHASPYAGQDTRAIKSLSAKDVHDLENGHGWGFAKAAELNGMPGPVHLLEIKGKIGLTSEQTAAVEKLYAAMKAEAIPLGKRLVALERILNAGFAGRDMDEIGKVRAKLRYVHLMAHLKTPALLTDRQIAHYNRLRGYGGDREGAH